MIRVAIREQLAGLILLASLIGLGVISVATWISNHDFVLGVVKSRLTLTASLKAAQLTSNLDLMQTTATLVSTRVIIQGALGRYDDHGDNTKENWAPAIVDMDAIMDNQRSPGQSMLLQSMIFAKNASGPAGRSSLLNVTSSVVGDSVELPLVCPDGKNARLGMSASDCGGYPFGYPPPLYPNLTYTSTTHNGKQVQLAEYHGDTIGPGNMEALLLGPWRVNASFALVSLTVPIINNTSAYDVLGWLTVLLDARLVEQVIDSAEGLQDTGQTLILGPVSRTNLFPNGILYNTNNGHPPKNFEVAYVISLPPGDASRHPNHVWGTKNPPFNVNKYWAVRKALTEKTGHADNSGTATHGTNEDGKSVAVGYAMPRTNIVNWLVVVEQAHSEVWQPINRLRNILLGCLFATAGFMAIVAFPLAHCAVLPIRRLREATAKSIEPPGPSFSHSSFDSLESPRGRGLDPAYEMEGADGAAKESAATTGAMNKWRQKRQEEREYRRENRRRNHFRIPGKVKERKHFVKDELTDLTRTFNEMSDELMMQYSRLEERVQQRTAELEESKIAAEAANESKTLFIANISHELKTPLNGILGMCAVCMQEDDPLRVKRSLGIIYKSGDLLLNLLNDLLTFSKNQVGQQLTLDEKEFRLRDVSSQILAVFDKQAQEGGIEFKVLFEGIPAFTADDLAPEATNYGPNGTGRLKDMVLWGDLQRILQVVINLVSNALKFTPSGGSVVLTVRCLPELATVSRNNSKASRQSPRGSRQSRQQSARNHGSDTTLPGVKIDTALAINAKDKPNANFYGSERAASPPPGVYLNFEFEVVDTGPGIAESLQNRIFEPFMQGDLGLSKKFGGTGLGLSICSQLASLMHGDMNVKSTLGSGSTFTMKIPLRHVKSRADSSASSTNDLPGQIMMHKSSADDLARLAARNSRHFAEETAEEKQPTATGPTSPGKTPPDMQPRLVGLSQPFFASSQGVEPAGSRSAAINKIATAATQATGNGNKIRVLVAEDNKVNQEVVLRMLKLEDVYDVTVAKDGQEALDCVKESMAAATPGGSLNNKPYDLIFMDVQMPNMDGLQSTQLIREIGYQAPIVALTAYADESNVKNCLESGMNYFLSKPIRRPQLKKVLKEYCPPIPEEYEEVTPPPEGAARPSQPVDSDTAATTTTSETKVQPGSQQNGQPKGDQALPEPDKSEEQTR